MNPTFSELVGAMSDYGLELEDHAGALDALQQEVKSLAPDLAFAGVAKTHRNKAGDSINTNVCDSGAFTCGFCSAPDLSVP